MLTSCPESRKENGRSNRALVTVKIAVFAAIPRASVSTIARVNRGDLARVRMPKRRSRRRDCMVRDYSFRIIRGESDWPFRTLHAARTYAGFRGYGRDA